MEYALSGEQRDHAWGTFIHDPRIQPDDGLAGPVAGRNDPAQTPGGAYAPYIIERFTRPELGRLVVEITIDDPGAYSKPWTVIERSQLAPGWELFDYVCNENNRDVPHLVGR